MQHRNIIHIQDRIKLRKRSFKGYSIDIFLHRFKEVGRKASKDDKIDLAAMLSSKSFVESDKSRDNIC